MTAIAIVINGVPRSGKSTLAAEIIRTETGGTWRLLGVDATMRGTPEHLLPGIGLRPGGEHPELEPFVLSSYQELFDSVALAVLDGSSVVVDVGIHDGYTRPLDIIGEMRRRLAPAPTILVGLHCSFAVLRERREASGCPSWDKGEPVPDPVRRWQAAVHADKDYDLELDSSTTSTAECAGAVRDFLRSID